VWVFSYVWKGRFGRIIILPSVAGVAAVRILSLIGPCPMNRRKDTKMRESDRENRLSGRWTGIGFVIVLLGALLALFLLMGGA